MNSAKDILKLSLDYKRFVASRPCLVGMGRKVRAHHLWSRGASGADWRKPHIAHFTCIPLSDEAHTMTGVCIHRLGIEGFNAYHRVDVWEENARLLHHFFGTDLPSSPVEDYKEYVREFIEELTGERPEFK